MGKGKGLGGNPKPRFSCCLYLNLNIQSSRWETDHSVLTDQSLGHALCPLDSFLVSSSVGGIVITSFSEHSWEGSVKGRTWHCMDDSGHFILIWLKLKGGDLCCKSFTMGFYIYQGLSICALCNKYFWTKCPFPQMPCLHWLSLFTVFKDFGTSCHHGTFLHSQL